MKRTLTSRLEKDRSLLADQILRRITNCSKFERDFGVTRNELLHIQKCETDPKLSTLSRIAEGLGCSAAELLLPGDLAFDEITFLISMTDQKEITECLRLIESGSDRLMNHYNAIRRLFSHRKE